MSKNKRHIFNNKKKTAKVIYTQNFLTNRRILNIIVGLSNITKDDIVVEIGTGKGHLTRILAQRCKYLYTIEIDSELLAKTRAKLSTLTNVKFIRGDFLKWKLPTNRNYKVFSNIPYSITTKIIRKLIESFNPAQEIWLVVEKGAAKRFSGFPKETKKSLFLKVHWETNIFYYIKKDYFHPKPSVDSALLHLSRKINPNLSGSDLTLYKRFIAYSFKYGLFSKKSLLTKKQISLALKNANLPSLRKNEKISFNQWLCLFYCYKNFTKNKVRK